MNRTAVMTLWTAPSRGALPGTAAMWSLSALCARQHFERLHLVTDRRGEELLCKRLGLPFDHVYHWCEHLPVEQSNVWALPKLHTYAMMANRGQRFVHLDGDVMLLKPLPERLLKARIGVEVPETWDEPAHWGQHLDRLEWVPVKWDTEWKSGRRAMWNCGVVVANDLSAVGQWASEAMAVSSLMGAMLSRADGTAASIWLEQWSMGLHWRQNQVETLFSSCPVSGEEADAAGYVHLKAGKRDPRIMTGVALELAKRFPEQAALLLETTPLTTLSL